MSEEEHTNNNHEEEEKSFLPGEDTSETAFSGDISNDDEPSKTIQLSGMYQDWFLDYASYVILERAVPHLNDGLKPVHRRILHTMRRMEDGRYNKVANLIGYTMQYHPHGDASIQDALVQLGQKELLIDTQGNWGNILTGDSAAAPRYIEARLTKFALDVVFNPKTTSWKLSYDGRNKEPITLPVKFPLLLAQGVEGIAVGLASKILPHNFNEIIDAAIAHLKGKDFVLYPDLPTGGLIDVERYNDGLRGGNVRIRAKIEIQDRKTLAITDIPYGKTTTSLIENILKAVEKKKINIKKIDDNTAEKVEILVHLGQGVSPDQAIDALYAFTDCEISISPNACVVDQEKPRFLDVKTLLRDSVKHTVGLLTKELEIRKRELEEEWHQTSLEKIFIEERIYRDIEECETWESVIEAIDQGLEPFKNRLLREVTQEDIIKLTEIRIKKISKYDKKKTDDIIKGLEEEIAEVKEKLNNIIEHTIHYYQEIKKKYGKNHPRLSEIRSFEQIEATTVAANNCKLFIDRENGFIGYDLKKEEYVCDCSDIDDIIIFLKDGTYKIVRISDKVFVGKNILHAGVFKRNDERTIYNLIYRDGFNGNIMAKRCAITAITRDRTYHITKGTKGSEILYFTANPDGEAEVLKIKLKPRPRLKKTIFDFDFSELAIKGKNAHGNILTRFAIHKIELKKQGQSTLGGQHIWFDEKTLRINNDENGKYLGEFFTGDKILIVMQNGEYRTSNFDITNHYEDNILLIEKYNPEKVFSAIYYDGEQKYHYAKRFRFEPVVQAESFIGDNPKSKLILLTDKKYPLLKVEYTDKNKNKKAIELDVDEFIGVKGFAARGKRVVQHKVKKVTELEPLDKKESTAPQNGKEEKVKSIDDNNTEDVPFEVVENKKEDENKDPYPGNNNRQITLEF